MARILVVDDQKTIVTVIEKLLASRGHSVTTASDTYDAVEKLSKQPFDLVVSDIVMPGGASGLDLIKTIRRQEKYKLLPVVLLTGRREKSDVSKGIQAGADDYIVKPIDPDFFLAKVESLLTNRTPIKFAQCPVNEGAKWNFSAQIVSVSEIGVQIISEISPIVGSKIKLESPIFEKIGIPTPTLHLITCNPGKNPRFPYVIEANFVGLTKSQLQPLRSYISSQLANRSA